MIDGDHHEITLALVNLSQGDGQKVVLPGNRQGTTRPIKKDEHWLKPIAKGPKRVIAEGIIRGMALCMIKRLSTLEAKAMREEFETEFKQKSFYLNSLLLDEWMVRQLKSRISHLVV